MARESRLAGRQGFFSLVSRNPNKDGPISRNPHGVSNLPFSFCFVGFRLLACIFVLCQRNDTRLEPLARCPSAKGYAGELRRRPSVNTRISGRCPCPPTAHRCPLRNPASTSAMDSSPPTGNGSRTAPTSRAVRRSTSSRFPVLERRSKSRPLAERKSAGEETARNCSTSRSTHA
jgi:hypothetical protein